MKMKFTKIIFAFLILLIVGCSKEESKEVKGIKEKVKLRIYAPQSIASCGILKMVEGNMMGDNVELELKTYNNMEKMLSVVAGKNYDIMITATNAAAKLYNKGMDLKLLGGTLWGGIYFATTDESCQSWKDLKGKKLYVPNKTSPPDIVTQAILKSYGIDIKNDLEIIYSSHQEISQLMESGNIEYGINVEPFITANKLMNKEIKVVSDFTEEWRRINGKNYNFPVMSLIADDVFVSEKSQLVEVFEEKYYEAAKWVSEHPKEAGEITAKYLNIKSEMTEKAIPNLDFSFRESSLSIEDLKKYYETLLEFNAETIGGKMPDENFYF